MTQLSDDFKKHPRLASAGGAIRVAVAWNQNNTHTHTHIIAICLEDVLVAPT